MPVLTLLGAGRLGAPASRRPPGAGQAASIFTVRFPGSLHTMPPLHINPDPLYIATLRCNVSLPPLHRAPRLFYRAPLPLHVAEHRLQPALEAPYITPPLLYMETPPLHVTEHRLNLSAKAVYIERQQIYMAPLPLHAPPLAVPMRWRRSSLRTQRPGRTPERRHMDVPQIHREKHRRSWTR